MSPQTALIQPSPSHRPSPTQERFRQDRLTRTLAVLFTTVVCVLVLAVLWAPLQVQSAPLTVIVCISFCGMGLYYFLTRRLRRRAAIRKAPFPDVWKTILEREVAFYRGLSPEEQQRFREEVAIFLQEKRITGIHTSVDDTVRILVACSAIIPIFGFSGWEWEQIREVLIYPNSFNEQYQTGESAKEPLLGMVGSGAMNRMMILSKPELLHGFRQAGDRHHVGIHEFTHLLDKSDGAVDGIPEVALPAKAIIPWLKVVHQEMERIRQGHSDINPYGLTNEGEFFAVAAEYFFEQPVNMQRRHPELYAMLTRIFRQDPQSRLNRAMTDLFKP